MDSFFDKYLGKGVDNLTKQDLNEIAEYSINKVIKDSKFVKQEFFGEQKSDKTAWQEFRKDKDHNYIIATIVISQLFEELKNKKPKTSQMYCHKCGTKLLE